MEDKNIKMPAMIFSRVVGYFQPVDQWNKGKKEEFAERKTLKYEERLNAEKTDSKK